MSKHQISITCPELTMRVHIKRIFDGEYDIPGLDFVSPPTILDIGANIGGFAVWAATRWPGANIICYEPHPANFELLKKNVNHGTEMYQVAVWGSDVGRMFLHNGLVNCGEHSLFKTESTLDTGQMVEIIPASKLPKADMLKIDTEGAEYEILSNYTYLDTEYTKVVMLEYHTITDRYRIGSMLIDSGFRFISDELWHKSVSSARGVMKWAKV